MISKRNNLTRDLPELMPPVGLLGFHQESGITAEIDHAHQAPDAAHIGIF
jgi:hypothetical protein